MHPIQKKFNRTSEWLEFGSPLGTCRQSWRHRTAVDVERNVWEQTCAGRTIRVDTVPPTPGRHRGGRPCWGHRSYHL